MTKFRNMGRVYHVLMFGMYVSTVSYNILATPRTPRQAAFGGRFKFLTFINSVSVCVYASLQTTCWGVCVWFVTTKHKMDNVVTGASPVDRKVSIVWLELGLSFTCKTQKKKTDKAILKRPLVQLCLDTLLVLHLTEFHQTWLVFFTQWQQQIGRIWQIFITS